AAVCGILRLLVHPTLRTVVTGGPPHPTPTVTPPEPGTRTCRAFTGSQIIYGWIAAGPPLNVLLRKPLMRLSIQFIILGPRAAATLTPPHPSSPNSLHPSLPCLPTPLPPSLPPSLHPSIPTTTTTPFLSKLIVSTPAECCGRTHCHTTSGRGKKGRESG
ncbi:unnamed protein product, partial [Pleuronectes platessa]